MKEFIDFTLSVLGELVSLLFSFDLGGYTLGDFLVVLAIVSVFIGSLVIRFRNAGSVSSVTKPPRAGKKGG